VWPGCGHGLLHLWWAWAESRTTGEEGSRRAACACMQARTHAHHTPPALGTCVRLQGKWGIWRATAGRGVCPPCGARAGTAPHAGATAAPAGGCCASQQHVTGLAVHSWALSAGSSAITANAEQRAPAAAWPRPPPQRPAHAPCTHPHTLSPTPALMCARTLLLMPTHAAHARLHAPARSLACTQPPAPLLARTHAVAHARARAHTVAHAHLHAPARSLACTQPPALAVAAPAPPAQPDARQPLAAPPAEAVPHAAGQPRAPQQEQVGWPGLEGRGLRARAGPISRDSCRRAAPRGGRLRGGGPCVAGCGVAGSAACRCCLKRAAAQACDPDAAGQPVPPFHPHVHGMCTRRSPVAARARSPSR